jgi:hypothetical protein
MFPKKRKLLTQEEYVKEGNEYTLKALQELKNYCSSPDCNTWKIVSRIKSPERYQIMFFFLILIDHIKLSS